MDTINVTTWEEFKDRLNSLRDELMRPQEERVSTPADFLFRGQSNHSWSLLTTLERYAKMPRIPMWEYYLKIAASKFQIEVFTDSKWDDFPSHKAFQEWLQDDQPFSYPQTLQGYDYMVYLRHHGYPSPLLDWTRSPFIAAYFAFRNVEENVNDVSIFAYVEYMRGGKVWSSDKPFIAHLGPYVRSHRRHFQQQCEYTICMEAIIESDVKSWNYAAHENAFAQGIRNQDQLWKFNIPASERLKVLKELETYNINAFSLFGNEESLMETMALKEFYLR